MTDRAAAFAEIYRTNGWNGRGTRSGPGSTKRATYLLQRLLPTLVAGVGARSVLDAGCGESLWMPDLPGYVGVDVVPAAIARAKRAFPKRDFRLLDIVTDELPRVDFVLCRDTLQHLPLADGMAALENMRAAGQPWLLAGTFEDGLNRDIEAGRYFDPDLSAPPFSLGKPWIVLEDGYWDKIERYPTKRLGMWHL